jgi:hypothetical protein
VVQVVTSVEPEQLGVLNDPVAAVRLTVPPGAVQPLHAPVTVTVNGTPAVEPYMVVAGLGAIASVGVAAVTCWVVEPLPELWFASPE